MSDVSVNILRTTKFLAYLTYSHIIDFKYTSPNFYKIFIYNSMLLEVGEIEVRGPVAG